MQASGSTSEEPKTELRPAKGLWWLSFRRGAEPMGAALIEAVSLDHARMIAALDGLDAGLSVTKGYCLSEKQAAAVARNETGRFLRFPEATQVQMRLQQ
jgi:hypothetical protein